MSNHSWEYDEDTDKSIESIMDLVRYYSDKYEVDGITVSGGEPFDQTELNDLLSCLKNDGYDDILVYTGYYLEELSEYKEALENISVLIDGPYVEELNDDLPLRGSSNQHIYIFDSKLADKYSEYLQMPRSFDVDFDNGIMTVIGLLPSEKENT